MEHDDGVWLIAVFEQKSVYKVTVVKPRKLFIADVRLPKTSWNAILQPSANSRKTSVPVAVGPPDNTSPQVDRTQLTTSFIRQLTDRGQVSRSHAGQQTVK